MQDYKKRYANAQEKNRTLARVQALSNLSIASSKANDYPKAISQLTDAIRICGTCKVLPILHKNLGLTYLHSEKYADGERELRLSLSLNGKDTEVGSALERLESLRQQSNEKR